MTAIVASSSSAHHFGSDGAHGLPPLLPMAAASGLYNDTLLPSDVEVSFGWEHDPEPSHSSLSPLSYPSSSSSPRSTSETQSPHSSSVSNATTLASPLTAAPAPAPASSPEDRQLALLIRSHSQGWARSFELHRDWPKPALAKPDEVLVRNVALGLNPVDFKSLLYKFGIERFPWVLGRDVAGVVQAVGQDVKHLKPGDRVWTCSDSRDVRAGAYQSFSVAKAFTVGKVADGISDNEAATLGTGLVTASVALFWFFKLTLPGQAQNAAGAADANGGVAMPSAVAPARATSQPPRWLLIFGGGAVTGLYAAQLARLAGIKVLSVASPSNFQYLTEVIGVHACVDRYSPPGEILSRIAEITRADGGRLDYALDCVGSTTAGICWEALREGGASQQAEAQAQAQATTSPAQLICLAGNPKRTREDDAGAAESSKERKTAGGSLSTGGVRTRSQAQTSAGSSTPTLASAQEPAAPRSITTHRISFSTTFYGVPQWTTQLLGALHTLLASGQLKPVRPILVPHGLAGVRIGLERLRDGDERVRARKLVVRVGETPDADVTCLGVKEDLGWNGCV